MTANAFSASYFISLYAVYNLVDFAITAGDTKHWGMGVYYYLNHVVFNSVPTNQISSIFLTRSFCN